MFILKEFGKRTDFIIARKSEFGGGMSIMFAKKARSRMADAVSFFKGPSIDKMFLKNFQFPENKNRWKIDAVIKHTFVWCFFSLTFILMASSILYIIG